MNKNLMLMRRGFAVGALVLAMGAAAKGAEAKRGLAAAEDFAGLPCFKDRTQTYQFSSTDPAEDQFNDYGHWLATDSQYGSVLANIQGPGCIYRIWSTGNDGDSDRIQIYLDGHKEPDIDQTFNVFHNRPPLMSRPQVGAGGEHYLAWWSYLPIPFRKSCKIIRQGNLRPFQNITYHTYTDDAGVSTWNGKENLSKLESMWSSPERDPKGDAGNITVRKTVLLRAGESCSVFEHEGAGYIARLRVAHYLPNKGLKIRMFWDDNSAPAVDVPMKWFFGSVGQGGDVHALGVGTIGGNGYCFFPMPFWRKARIEIANLSDVPTGAMDVEVQYNERAYEENAAGYFCAQANEAVHPGDRYTCLRVRGRGHVVGMAKRMPVGDHPCEGAEIFYIDDRRFPDIHGTGEEDYSNCAWWPNEYNTYPTHGCVGHDCYYRIHFPDLLVFEQSIDMEFECWQDGYIASLVWYYFKDRPGVTLTDSLTIGDKDSELQHGYRISGETWVDEKTGSYPGKRVSSIFDQEAGRSFAGASEFTVKIDPKNEGVRLRVRTEHVNFQEVSVWVDGVLVTERPWSIVKDPSDALWVDSDFEVPGKYTHNKYQIRVKLEHVAPHPNWIEYHYDVFSYR